MAYDVNAKPPDSRDKILTNEIRHTESRAVAGERMALEAIGTSGSRRFFGI